MDREEKRRLLRQKIASKSEQRTGMPSAAARVRSDPTSALMSMGVDDPALLAHAASMSKNVEVLKQTSRALKQQLRDERVEEPWDEDEEAPPG